MNGFRMLIGGLVLMGAFTLVAAQNTTPITPGKRPIYPRFEVDVLVDGRPLREYYSRGRTHVEAVRGEEYQICLRNRSGDRVAVALSVDGLNTIDASRTSAWDASKWVIEPYQTITISGWQMSSAHARRFYFTDERDSYAAKLGRRGNIGVISAVFFRERRHVIVAPPSARESDVLREERQSSMGGAAAPSAAAKSRSRDDAATGIGRAIDHDVRFVEMDLDSRPAAEVTIRYEYRSTFAPDPPCRVPCRRDN